jgi:hypothetical protein
LKGSCLCGDRSLPRRRPPSVSSTSVPDRWPASATLSRYPIRDEIARRLQLPSKLMAQHKFGTCRRIVLSFERQPFPAPCHVDQDVAHPRAWRALGHLTTFDRVLSALHRRNHLPYPYIRPMLPQASGVVSMVSRPGCTSGPIVAFAPQHTWRAAGPHAQGKSMRYELRAINFHLGRTPPREPQGGMERTGCAAA